MDGRAAAGTVRPMRARRTTRWVAAAGAAAALALTACGGDDGGGGGSAGADIYSSNCASCHGADGGGGAGPRLSGDRLVETYPDIDDQIAVIAEGRGAMPAFGDQLSRSQIESVARYEREELG